jgi:hypothetical protein
MLIFAAPSVSVRIVDVFSELRAWEAAAATDPGREQLLPAILNRWEQAGKDRMEAPRKLLKG